MYILPTVRGGADAPGLGVLPLEAERAARVDWLSGCAVWAYGRGAGAAGARAQSRAGGGRTVVALSAGPFDAASARCRARRRLWSMLSPSTNPEKAMAL